MNPTKNQLNKDHCIPLVTLVIPSYNHEKFVELSINSALKQTYSNIELFVYDDGSTDNSRDIIEKLSKKHGFYFKAQKNQGLTNTLNEALKKSQGKYFCMLSSDDIIFPDKLEKQVAYMEKNPNIGLCGGSVILIDNDGICDAKQNILPNALLDFDDTFLMKKSAPHSVTMLTRKSVLDEIGGYDPKIRLEDVDMWLKITHAGYPISCINDVYAYYRKHENNTYKQVEFMHNCLLQSYDKYSSHPNHEAMKQKIIFSTILKASKRNKKLAWKLIKNIPLRQYNSKVARALLRLLFS